MLALIALAILAGALGLGILVVNFIPTAVLAMIGAAVIVLAMVGGAGLILSMAYARTFMS